METQILGRTSAIDSTNYFLVEKIVVVVVVVTLLKSEGRLAILGGPDGPDRAKAGAYPDRIHIR